MRPPQLPQRQQVQPRPEPKLADKELFASRPRFGKPAPTEKNCALLIETFTGEIHIAMPAREWQRVGEFQVGQGWQALHQTCGRVAVTM
jgi:hypothetical protein